MEHTSLDPKTLKVSQLRRILVENDVTFPANARKPALVKLFEENVRERVESSSGTPKGKDSVRKAVKSEVKNADRKKSLKNKKHESSSGASKTVKDNTFETNKRKREESSKDDASPPQVKEEKSSKKKRKKRSNKVTKALESLSKPKLESKEPLVTLSSEVETREEHKENLLCEKPIAEKFARPELPNLKVSNEFLVQLNKELASATTESYDHSIKSSGLSSTRAETEGPSNISTEAEPRSESDPMMINTDKNIQGTVDNTKQKEVEEKLVTAPSSLENQDKKRENRKFPKANTPKPKGRSRHFLGNKTKRGIDIIKPFFAHVFIWLWNSALYLSIVLPILFGLWFREQRIRIGYCGHEEPMKSLALSSFPQTQRVDDYLQVYGPSCLKCPEHALCSSFMNIKCEPGYELRSSVLETYGIVPFLKYCVKDESKEKEVDELVWKVREYLRKKNGQVDCGEGENLFESGETESNLYHIFSNLRPSWENQKEFNEHWKNVVDILKNNDEIVWLPLDFEMDNEGHLQSKTSTCVFRSTSKRHIKLQCHLGADIQEGLKKYGGSVLIALSVLFFIKKVQSTLNDYVQGEQIIEKLVKEAIGQLKNAKNDEEEESFLTTVQLRTILLKDVPKMKEQNSLWAQTKDKIIKEQSENIELYLLEENGEIMTCWEWKD
ncbi:hypothetical protein SUVZ_02G5640 [Saccharomyces uvarum]|uniref:Heh2p n=1 Tax=Saccharomyces uvarum TaxID=230603 RepID=A0ABN8WUY7_SACUV|nr:hypothetical protein SUVZ_02G5640 [Saccharomyces uvarum]